MTSTIPGSFRYLDEISIKKLNIRLPVKQCHTAGIERSRMTGRPNRYRHNQIPVVDRRRLKDERDQTDGKTLDEIEAVS